MVDVPNQLVHDVEHFVQEIMRMSKERIAQLYPAGSDQRPVVGYIWARTVPCSNTSCRASIPLLSTLLLSNKDQRRVALTLTVDGKDVSFGIAKGKTIARTEGTMLDRGNCRCEVCKQPTPVRDIRQAGKDKTLGERLVAVITEGSGGKDYRLPEQTDLIAIAESKNIASHIVRPTEAILPEITQKGIDDDDVANSTGIRVHQYGFTTWGSIFNDRQLVAVQTLTECLREVVGCLPTTEPAGFGQAVACYLGIWFDRMLIRLTSFGRWDAGEQAFQTPFDMGKISMMWDYAELCPFNTLTGGGGGQLDWITRFIEHESVSGLNSPSPALVLLGDAASLSLKSASVDCVVTDPPYFNMYAYADLSDVFYTWLKRGLYEVFPDKFATPQTPKDEEATALAHRHGGDMTKAEQHFTNKLAACFKQVRRICKPEGVVTVIFAHQTTKAWTALVHALFDAGLNITATFPIDMELKNRSRGQNSSALESSITVVCRPRVAIVPGSFKEVRLDIERVVKESVHRFWGYGFRGADLIVACYGPAVGEFGRYERVERGDGKVVTVPELLQIVRESALKAIAGEFTGDPLSRLYFVWANMYGVNQQPWDDVRLVVQMSGEAENAMDVATGRGLFVVDGSNSRLAVLADRAGRTHLGDDRTSPLIDQLHRAMLFWKKEDRAGLVQYLQGHELADHTGFWKLAQALFEVMPRDAEDWKLVSALLGERNTLRTEIKRRDAALTAANAGLFDGHDE